jgi:hypothetical protein
MKKPVISTETRVFIGQLIIIEPGLRSLCTEGPCKKSIDIFRWRAEAAVPARRPPTTSAERLCGNLKAMLLKAETEDGQRASLHNCSAHIRTAPAVVTSGSGGRQERLVRRS